MLKEISSGTIINNIRHIFFRMLYELPRGLVVRIRRSHRRGPGSIPGVGIVSFFLENLFLSVEGFDQSPIKALWKCLVPSEITGDESMCISLFWWNRYWLNYMILNSW